HEPSEDRMRLKNLTNQDHSLSSILECAARGEYAIPVFQRDFVWKTSQCRALADSIIRGYPIGSLLLMPTGGRLNVSADPLKSAGAELKNGGKTYVMDGQQRLTSIHKIFLADG